MTRNHNPSDAITDQLEHPHNHVHKHEYGFVEPHRSAKTQFLSTGPPIDRFKNLEPHRKVTVLEDHLLSQGPPIDGFHGDPCDTDANHAWQPRAAAESGGITNNGPTKLSTATSRASVNLPISSEDQFGRKKEQPSILSCRVRMGVKEHQSKPTTLPIENTASLCKTPSVTNPAAAQRCVLYVPQHMTWLFETARKARQSPTSWAHRNNLLGLCVIFRSFFEGTLFGLSSKEPPRETIFF